MDMEVFRRAVVVGSFSKIKTDIAFASVFWRDFELVSVKLFGLHKSVGINLHDAVAVVACGDSDRLISVESNSLR